MVQWGGDLAEPIQLPNSPAGVIVKSILLLGTLLDFVLASTTVNRWVLRVCGACFERCVTRGPSQICCTTIALQCAKVKFDFDLWNVSNAGTWLQYSWPSSVLAVVMAICVPKLESLTSLLNSIAGATLQITAVPCALWLTKHHFEGAFFGACRVKLSQLAVVLL